MGYRRARAEHVYHEAAEVPGGCSRQGHSRLAAILSLEGGPIKFADAVRPRSVHPFRGTSRSLTTHVTRPILL